MITQIQNPIPTTWIRQDTDNDAAFGMFEFYDENGQAKFEVKFANPEAVRDLIRVAEWTAERMELAQEYGFNYLIDHCGLKVADNSDLTVDDILGEDGI